MVYADYGYYTDVFGGTTISEQAFPRCVAQSSAYLDNITLGRAEEHAQDERLKMCCCALAETVYSTADTGGLVKQSESVGSWSYSLSGSAAQASAQSVMYACCRTWLPAEWLYRGVARE